MRVFVWPRQHATDVVLAGFRKRRIQAACINPLLNTARPASPADDGEIQTLQAPLEKAAFLPVATHILHHGIPWFSTSCRSASRRESQAGTIRSREGTKEARSTINLQAAFRLSLISGQPMVAIAHRIAWRRQQ